MSTKSIDILGVKINRITMPEVLELCNSFIRSRRVHYIVTPNPEIIIKANTDEEYRTILNNANLALPDGIGVVWAGRVANAETDVKNKILKSLYYIFFALTNLLIILFARKRIFSVIPERVTGADLVWEIAKLAAERGYTIYFLGGMPGVAAKTAEKLKFFYPNLKIAGTYAGYPGENSLADRIRVARPDILFVAFGSPKQEKFIAENILKLGVPIAIGVGGAFDFISGKLPRAPKIIRALGLEWLWRFCRQPKRVKRVFNAFPRFVSAVILWKLNQG